jgi:hypothetical protein
MRTTLELCLNRDEVGRQMVSKDIHILTPRSWEYVTLLSKKDFLHVIEMRI